MELRILKVVFTAALVSFILLSCNSTASPDESIFAPGIVEETPTLSPGGLPRTEADVPRVSLEDTLTGIQNGEALIVDVRSPDAYRASHIPGALSIPLGEIETNPTDLPFEKDQWIITYCT